MKKTITFFCLILVATGLFAQAPAKLSFQAVVRNSNGELLKNSNVGFRIQVLQSSEFGAAVYVETHESTTNENGLVSLEIGGGTVVAGKLDTLDWKKGPYFLKTEIDPDGGTNYTITGTTQLLSVPYALYAETANYPAGMVTLATAPVTGDMLLFDGTGWKALPKGNDGQVLTMVSGMPAWKDVSTGKELGALHDPVLEILFKDRSGSHNMGIATDGKYYYTCNGGNYTLGRINKYTLTGDSITSYPIALDMRSIMYNKSDGNFYASGFESNTSERNIYKITSLANGTFDKVLPNLYDYYQSSVAMSDDGAFLYAFNKGTLKQYKLSDGSLVDTFTGLNYGNSTSADGAVAVDPDYFYTWNPTSGEVYVYDHTGTYVKSISLSNGNYGYSLSWANGYLFAAKDGSYGTGTWYGYNIRMKLSETPLPDLKMGINEQTSMPDVKDSTHH
jgi:hypothetical protein